MTKLDFANLYRYQDWANDQLVQMLASAFGETTDLRAAGGVVLAIQETAAHLLGAQRIWRHRWEQVPLPTPPDFALYPTPAALRLGFAKEQEAFQKFFASVDDDSLMKEIAFHDLQGRPWEMPLWQMMQHVVTHGMYHRGQITARLMDMGHESHIVSTDLIGFYRIEASTK